MGQQLGVKPGRPGSSWKQEGRGQAFKSLKGKQQRETHRVGQSTASWQGTERKEGEMRGQEEEVQVHVKYNKHSGRLLL